jgi:DNA-binding transcriptional LysR family regulator
MDIEKLQAFITLAKTKSFTKTADALYISQPALSKQIQSLEQELQVPLFNRAKKSSNLTIYGEYFQAYAQNILMNFLNAKEHIKQIENLEQGTLSFGATNFIGVYLVPPILAFFRQLYPGITINMTINASKNILNLLNSYNLEFILLSDYVKIDEERFIRKTWRTDQLKVIVGHQSPLYKKRVLTIEDLNNQVLITKSKTSSLYKFLIPKLIKDGLQLSHPLFISNQEAIKQAVINNIGISIMSPLAIQLEEKLDLIKALPIKGETFNRKISIVHERNRHLTPATIEFLKLLK